MEKTFTIKKPEMPSNVYLEMPPGRKQDGFCPTDKAPGAIKVRDLSREEAGEYAELMKQTFIEHWENEQ